MHGSETFLVSFTGVADSDLFMVSKERYLKMSHMLGRTILSSGSRDFKTGGGGARILGICGLL